jgi:hypothetical protein
VAAPAGRFNVAFDDDTLVWDVTWTALDQEYPNLVTSYTIDRGRQYELDRTDTGRAVVELADIDGILDPTNPDGPYYGKLEPLRQACIARHNPVTDTWHTRFRGFVEDFDYSFDPSQQVNRLTVSLVDIFEILAAVEMVPDAFGADPAIVAPDSTGQIVFVNQDYQPRIEAVLTDAHIPEEFFVVFTGNVELATSVYSAGESPMTVVAEACDGEFPGVSNCYVDRLGRLAAHGRRAKFDPVTTAEGADWDFHQWKAGDGAAVTASPTDTAQIRRFAFNRGLSKVINSAQATPMWTLNEAGSQQVLMPDTAAAGQASKDDASLGKYGYRSWSALNLNTLRGLAPETTALEETKKFADYYVANYAAPRDRVTDIAFRSMRPDDSRAAANWELLSLVDVSDLVQVTVASPGGGGFDAAEFFVEGVHEQVGPLVPGYDDVTLSLDLSPRAYFDDVSMFG